MSIFLILFWDYPVLMKIFLLENLLFFFVVDYPELRKIFLLENLLFFYVVDCAVFVKSYCLKIFSSVNYPVLKKIFLFENLSCFSRMTYIRMKTEKSSWLWISLLAFTSVCTVLFSVQYYIVYNMKENSCLWIFPSSFLWIKKIDVQKK